MIAPMKSRSRKTIAWVLSPGQASGFLVFGLTLVMVVSAAANWPAWRGDASGSGRAGAGDYPVQWGPDRNVRWKVELPERGNSTPIVWGDRIFVTQALEADQRRTLMCFDRKSGRLLWRKGTTWTEEEESHPTNPYCSASPVTDGERVIAWFGSAGVFAYDPAGRELWKRDLGRQDHEWGYGTSPVLHGDLCILYFGPGERQFLIALDKRTGGTVWKTEQPELMERPRTDGFRGREQGGIIGSFSTPIIVDTDRGAQLVMSYPQLLCGYDPGTGEELWRADGLNELIYTSPLAGEGVIVGMGGFLGTSIAVAAGPAGDGDGKEKRALWKSVRTKNRLGSGVIHGGHIYVLNSDGIAECFELKTGREVWQERLPKEGPKGDSWSSMLLVGDLLYVLNQSADTVVLEASPKFKVVAVNPLDGALTNASLAASDGEFFIRTHTHLWCIAQAEVQAGAEPVLPPAGLRVVENQ